MRAWPNKDECSHQVHPDDQRPTSLSRFLADMAQLEEHEQDLVMTVHLLAGMLEGTATLQY